MLEIRPGVIIGGRFEVGPYLGGGGYACVWHGRDNKLSRDVAIKRLNSHGMGDVRTKQEAVEEARKIAALSHPNVVAVYDVIEQDDEILIIMEFLSGGTLHEHLRGLSRKGRWIEHPDALSILQDILRGLKAAHTSPHGPVIHKDLKPLNILFDNTGKAKIADFGLASVGILEKIETAHPGRWEHEGTQGYKSPEQLKGARLDERSDLFNVGLIAYLLLVAAHPFVDPRFLFDFKEMVLEPYRNLPAIKMKALPDELTDLVVRLLSMDPETRCASAAECLADLEHIHEQYNRRLLDRALRVYDALRRGAPADDLLSAAELAIGIRLCKKDGLFSQGRFLYEYSGVDFEPLHPNMREDLENDYYVCRKKDGERNSVVVQS